MKHTVICDRGTVALYLAWEYGIGYAASQMRNFKYGDNIPNPISHNGFKRKKDAESFANRVSQAAAYMSGKLGRDGFGATVTIRSSK